MDSKDGVYNLMDPVPLKSALDWWYVRTLENPPQDKDIRAWCEAHPVPMTQLDFVNGLYEDWKLRH